MQPLGYSVSVLDSTMISMLKPLPFGSPPLLGPHHFGVTRSLLGERSESVVSSYTERSSGGIAQANLACELRRKPFSRTSENLLNTKFAEFLFHAPR